MSQATPGNSENVERTEVPATFSEEPSCRVATPGNNENVRQASSLSPIPRKILSGSNDKLEACRTFSEEFSAPRFTRQDRIGYVTTIVAAFATLFIARFLDPSSNGVGTHEQLGLPPCPFLHLTGLPCPTCGFTTCFAYGMRLHLVEAVIAHPFGFLVFCLTIASIPISVFLLCRRIAWARVIRLRGANIVVYGLIALCLLGWLYKIIIMKFLFTQSYRP